MTQPQQYGATPTDEPTRKRGWRKMTWLVLVVNAAFLAWVIAGIAGSSADDCRTMDQATCDAANGIGTTIGVGIIFVLWLVVDFILLVLWLITKPRQR